MYILTSFDLKKQPKILIFDSYLRQLFRCYGGDLVHTSSFISYSNMSVCFDVLQHKKCQAAIFITGKNEEYFMSGAN